MKRPVGATTTMTPVPAAQPPLCPSPVGEPRKSTEPAENQAATLGRPAGGPAGPAILSRAGQARAGQGPAGPLGPAAPALGPAAPALACH